MATNNQQSTSVKYKFGSDELDLKDYIRNLDRNYQSYVDSRNWSDGQRAEFKQAYDTIRQGLQDQLENNTNRFSTDYAGTLADTAGQISNTDNDDIDPVGSQYYYDNKGNRITTDDYNLLSKGKQKNYSTFSANKQVATFLNKVGTALRNKRMAPVQSASNAFDLAKNGFVGTWRRANNPAGGTFNLDPYIEKDAIDEETGVRGTTNRAAYLKQQIDDYINNIGDYDFSNSAFKDKDSYIAKLRSASESLTNGYTPEAAIALNQAGISNDFLSQFFATGSTKTAADKAEEDIAKMKKEDEDAATVDQRDQMIYERERDQYFKDQLANLQFNPVQGTAIAPTYNLKGMRDALAHKYGLDPQDEVAMQNAVKSYIDFSQLASLMRGNGNKIMSGGKDITQQHISNNLDWAAQANLFTDKLGDTGYYVVPNSENYNTWSYLAYNPSTRQYQEYSMLNNSDLSEELNKALRERMAYAEYDRRVSKQENGGVLKHQLGGLSKLITEEKEKIREAKQKEEDLKQQAKEQGRTDEQVKAGQRKPGETGFTAAEYARLASAVADVGSIIASFVPGYGTVASAGLGLGSTVVNLGNDLLDDSVSGWDAAKNAGLGLAMDVVGLIPGLGIAGKSSKIAKTLKNLAPYAIAAWGAYQNGGAPIEALNNLMSGKTLTVDEWKALGAGLQMLAGGARHFGGKRAVKRVTGSKDVVDVTTNTGKATTISRENFDKLRKIKGLDSQNKFFSEIADGQQLQREFKRPEFKWKVWNSRLIGDGPDYNKRTERWVLPEASGRDVNLLRRWNPEKPAPVQKPIQEPAVQPSPEKPIRVNSQLSRIRFDKAVDKGIQTRDQIRTIEYWKKRYPKRFQGKSDEEILNIINEQRQLSKKKQGGILDRVRKFQSAGKFPQWYSNLYKFQNLTGWNNTLNQSLAGPSITNENAGHYRAGDLNEAYNKNNSYTSNSNLVGQDLQSYYNSSFNGKPLETFVNEYNSNAAKIRGYWDEERAYNQQGATEHNRLFKNMFNNRSNDSNNAWNIGYDTNLEDVVGSSTWLRRMDRYEKEFDQLSDEEKKSRIHTIDLGNGNYGQVYKKANGDIAILPQNSETPKTVSQDTQQQNTTYTDVESSTQNTKPNIINNVFQDLFNNPTLTYGLPRALYADRMNRRMTDLAKDSTVPYLKDPLQVHRYTRSDLDAEMQGERNYANLRRLASQPLTSDGSLQTATQLQAEVQGQEARTAGKEKSNQVQRQYDELAWQQEKENAANRHDTAMFNRNQLWETNKIKSAMEQAYLSKKYNIWDVFAQQLEYEAKSKQAENKNINDNFARQDIHNAVTYKPNDYGANLSESELAAWNKVLSGANPSSLTPEEQNIYLQAARKVSQIEQDQLRQYYKVPNNRWSGIRGIASDGIVINKKGGTISADSKIAIAGIKARTADAERFQRSIKECIDRNEKAIDRLSKGFYGYIKRFR